MPRLGFVSRLSREPLVHFLAAGLGLFLLFNLTNKPDEHNSRIITVDRESLATFMQFRSRAFPPDGAFAMLDAMDGERLEGLIREYVREEALYREALSLGLDRNDYIIKRRLAQSAEFVAAGPETEVAVADEELAAYYESQKANYRMPATATFTHVYFSADKPGAEGKATVALASLNDERVPFTGAGQYGERFPYFLNYVERDESFVAGHFGRDFAAEAFQLAADPDNWTGPVRSAFGYHLLLVTEIREAYVPALAEIKGEVRADLVREKLERQREAALREVVERYEVRRRL